MVLLISVLAAVARASSARSSTLGTIKAASTPMMTKTTMSSIKVKPRCSQARRDGEVLRSTGNLLPDCVSDETGNRSGSGVVKTCFIKPS